MPRHCRLPRSRGGFARDVASRGDTRCDGRNSRLPEDHSGDPTSDHDCARFGNNRRRRLACLLQAGAGDAIRGSPTCQAATTRSWTYGRSGRNVPSTSLGAAQDAGLREASQEKIRPLPGGVCRAGRADPRSGCRKSLSRNSFAADRPIRNPDVAADRRSATGGRAGAQVAARRMSSTMRVGESSSITR